jgi:acid phosphatase (class A)
MRSLLKLLLVVTMLGGIASAKDTSDSFKYLTKDQELADVAAIPPKPAPGSSVDQADLAAILDAQKNRTPDMIAEAKLDAPFSATLFQSVYGANITPDKYPKFYALMKNTLKVSSFVDGKAKEANKRPRPYVGHPDVVHSLFPAEGFSYPSGHSTGSYTLAVVLGAVFPDKAQAFLDRAAKIAQSRVDAGVHYPSDIQEGEVVGKKLGAEILASPAFQKDLADVQQELKK